MQGEPGVAVGTLPDPAAIVTGEHGREAAPVEEQQHLIAGPDLFAHEAKERRRQSGA